MEGRRAKYIVVDDLFCENIIVFGHELIHHNVAIKFGLENIISAGFVTFTDKGPECYGRSTSLKRNSRPEEDTKLAKLTFGE